MTIIYCLISAALGAAVAWFVASSRVHNDYRDAITTAYNKGREAKAAAEIKARRGKK